MRRISLEDPESLLVIAGVLTIFLAVITGSICAISFLRLSILEWMYEENDDKKAGKLLKILEINRDRVLSGFSLLRLLLGMVIGALLVLVFFEWFKVHPRNSYYIAIFSIIFVVVMGETIPRFLARLDPERALKLMYPVVRVVSAISIPISTLSQKIISPITKKYNLEMVKISRITEGEIRRIIEAGHQLGVLEKVEKQMLNSIIEFSDTIAREVMIPRVDIVGLKKNATITEVINVMVESGFSRIPIYEDSLDEILGFVYTKDLLKHIKEGKLDKPALEVIRKPPFFVPDTKPVDELLREMQSRHISIAVVVDEYGGTHGLVTIEDLLEEIVGEITDEYDRELPNISRIGKDIWRVVGSTIIEDVNEELDLKIPTDEHETIGGFVYGHLGHIPHEAESMTLDDLGIDIKVEEIDGQRISLLEIKKHKRQEEEEEQGKEKQEENV